MKSELIAAEKRLIFVFISKPQYIDLCKLNTSLMILLTGVIHIYLFRCYIENNLMEISDDENDYI
ncbi:hypothetical protein C7H79_12180 [Nitrosomonas supralitoralis]|uniref:Uncharacterized protein n=1 Tax=Nitrosomonas supralitoralis TaxID=2116706 RepID=A0A2P7NT60_9PROT|nr:hypothetical protein C7H79_12180 [Nitrosomonas supralitoralis]